MVRSSSGGPCNGAFAACPRITSYNVCYTKLLRIKNQNILPFRGVVAGLKEIHRYGIMIAAVTNASIHRVMTSYSIHYTKLYDTNAFLMTSQFKIDLLEELKWMMGVMRPCVPDVVIRELRNNFV